MREWLLGTRSLTSQSRQAHSSRSSLSGLRMHEWAFRLTIITLTNIVTLSAIEQGLSKEHED